MGQDNRGQNERKDREGNGMDCYYHLMCKNHLLISNDLDFPPNI